MQQSFDIIKNARSLLLAIPKSNANDKTKAGYVRAMQRLFAAGQTPQSLIAAAMDTKKRRHGSAGKRRSRMRAGI